MYDSGWPNPVPRTAATGMAEVVRVAESRLRNHSYRRLRDVSCECARGVLVLRGRMPTYYLKQIAQAAVAGIDGVRLIQNRIDVF